MSSDTAQSSCTILYIEDNAANITLVRAILSQRDDVEFISAGTAGEGIAMANKRIPDLILLDLRLPDMYGTQTFRRFQSDPRTADIPVIALSADVSNHRVSEILELGFAGFIAKPFDPDDLLARIDSTLAAS